VEYKIKLSTIVALVSAWQDSCSHLAERVLILLKQLPGETVLVFTSVGRASILQTYRLRLERGSVGVEGIPQLIAALERSTDETVLLGVLRIPAYSGTILGVVTSADLSGVVGLLCTHVGPCSLDNDAGRG
jgi:hypothetical protein